MAIVEAGRADMGRRRGTARGDKEAVRSEVSEWLGCVGSTEFEEGRVCTLPVSSGES